jgi:hypothetical protein
MSLIDSVFSSRQSIFDHVGRPFQDMSSSKNELEELKKAFEALSKVTHEIKEDDSSISIQVKGFPSLAKENVKIVKQDGGWFGTVTLKEGRIEFFVHSSGFQISFRVELQKEEKAEKGDPQTPRNFYSSQSSTQAEFFKSAADVATLKGELQGQELKLTLQKQKEEVLTLS